MKKGLLHAALPAHLVSEMLQQLLQRRPKGANLNQTQTFDFVKLRALKSPEMILNMMKEKPTSYKQTYLNVLRARVHVRVCTR